MASGNARRRVRTAWAAVVVCLIAGSVSATSASASTTRQHRIAWAKCAGLTKQFQCAWVAVPLDWSRPHGQQISLALIRHLASKPGRRIGSMFLDPGGPGQSGVDLVRDGADDLDKWGGGRFDLIGWDPRGTNRSAPVECFTSNAARDRFWKGVRIPSTRAESEAYQRKTVELARRCGQVSGKLLSHITTADTARDLDRMRQLVGDRKLTYTGLSYGSLIGQTYANLFPNRIRAMMLDGIVNPVNATTSAEARTSTDVSSADEVFAQFVKLCQRAGPRECALAGHGESVARRVAGLFAAARKAPIPAPHASPPGNLSYGDLLVTTFMPLRLPLTWPQFAKDLEAAVQGDASVLETQARASQSPEVMATGVTWSVGVSCGDGPARLSSAQWPQAIRGFTASGKLWGRVLGWWLWAPCASNWPAHATDRYTGPWNRETKTRILLLGARYDAGTPYRNAQIAERRLGNAVLLTLNGYGHPSFQVPSKCMDRARERYLVHLITPPRGSVCQPDEAPFGQ